MYQYCEELKKLRLWWGSQRLMASQCGVSRETIRLIELGKLVPSVEVLTLWLDVKDLKLTDRTDIVSSVLQAKYETTSAGRDIKSLEAIAAGEMDFSHTDNIIQELTAILMETEGMTEGMRTGQRKRIERVFEKHGFDK